MKKQKFNLDELKVQSFVTEFDKADDQTNEIQGGRQLEDHLDFGFTGNCGTFINVTCKNGCDFQSIPLNECTTRWTVCGVACSKVPVIYC